MINYIALILVVLTSIFAFLGFLYPDKGKKSAKEILNKFNTALKEKTLFRVELQYFNRVYKRIRNIKDKYFYYFLLITFLINLFAIPVFCLFVEYLKNDVVVIAWNNLMQYKMYQTSELWRTLLIHFCAGLIGMILDLVSLKITLFFLKKLSGTSKSILLILHSIFNVLIIFIFSIFLLPVSVVFNWAIVDDKNTWNSFSEAFSGTFADGWIDTLIILLYGATSSIPTLLYLLGAIFILMMKIFPVFLRKLLIDIIAALTREGRNVFTDISALIGAITAIFGAIEFLFD